MTLIPPGNLEYNAPWFKIADAEQAKETGGCLMLFPRQDFAQNLAIPGGEPPEDLHVTMVYFGEDMSERPSPDDLIRAIGGVADQYPPIVANAFGHAAFNPAGADPCAVYIIGGSRETDRPRDLGDLHNDLVAAIEPLWDLSQQHYPWQPHMTAGYGMSPGQLSYTGEVVFDRLGLSWMGHTTWFPLA